MGLIYTEIALSNPLNSDPQPVKTRALVDTSVNTLCIPEHVAVQLDLQESEKREVTTADGKHIAAPYVGPIQVCFGNRSCFTGALVLGDSVLMGAVPLEDMDPVINPRMQTIEVNPESPNLPSALVKGAVRILGEES